MIRCVRRQSLTLLVGALLLAPVTSAEARFNPARYSGGDSRGTFQNGIAFQFNARVSPKEVGSATFRGTLGCLDYVTDKEVGVFRYYASDFKPVKARVNEGRFRWRDSNPFVRKHQKSTGRISVSGRLRPNSTVRAKVTLKVDGICSKTIRFTMKRVSGDAPPPPSRPPG